LWTRKISSIFLESKNTCKNTMHRPIHTRPGSNAMAQRDVILIHIPLGRCQFWLKNSRNISQTIAGFSANGACPASSITSR
jgi:hypothetical protein